MTTTPKFRGRQVTAARHPAKSVNRRGFLRKATSVATAVMAPQIIPSSALGLDGATPPSERITVGAIGIGNRGTYDLGCFLEQHDAQVTAVCDVKQVRRNAAKELVDGRYQNGNCRTFRDFRDLLAESQVDAVLIATGPNWHSTAAHYAAHAGKDIYCEKPCTKNIAESLELKETMRRTARVFQAGTQRRSLPHFAFACQLAREGKLGKLKTLYAHPAGMTALMSGWLPAEPEPARDVVDWDLYLGPAAWRPYNAKLLDGFNFEKGGGLVGGGVLEWGSHCVDLCQWAMADASVPVEYNPPVDGQLTATYANGVQLVLRETGWAPLGSCPVRFEGETGWVEVGDSGKMLFSSPELLAGSKINAVPNYPATFHVRNFLDCVRTRSQPKTNASAACNAHIACHAANIALALNRKVVYDPSTQLFVGDDEANRLRSEAKREPWRS